MAGVRVRADVGTLGTEADPWHPVVLGYARAVAAMQALPLTNPISWTYQAAMHGRQGPVAPNARWNECQHATWYFLPWHRMYLAQFEAIVGRFVTQAGGPADWALPFWDYEAAGRNRLPAAFRRPTLPDGAPNPLFVPERHPLVNQGASLPASVTSSTAALAATAFTSSTTTVAFGGPRTGFAHQGPAFGALEAQPHGPIHVVVGGQNGFMRDPDLAALDPIFWLHHANIDRLWELWNRRGRPNETASRWTSRTFRLHRPDGTLVTMRVRDVLDIEGALGYTYAGLPPRPPAPAPGGGRQAEQAAARPELIGANTQPAALGGRAQRVSVDLTTPRPRRGRAADEPRRVLLDIGDIVGDTNPGVVYGVYVNQPDGASAEQRDAHLAGVVSFFGIAQAARDEGQAGSLRYIFDITDLADRLAAEDRWDPAHLDVDFEPIELGDEPGEAPTHAPVTIGSVRVFVQ